MSEYLQDEYLSEAYLSFTPTDPGEGSSLGAYIRAGTDGDYISSQLIAFEEWLNAASLLFDGSGNAISSTGGALDVNLFSGSFVLSSEYDEDSAHVSGDKGQLLLNIRADDLSAVPASILADTEGDYQGFISASNGGLFVEGLNFDIRALSSATDSIEIADGGNSISIDAIDLDLRQLSSSSDSVASWLSDGSGNAIGSTTGSLNIHISNSGDIDLDDDIADNAIENSIKTISDTASSIVTSSLANRKWLFLANLGSRAMYLGDAAVSDGDGFPLLPNERMLARVGPSIAPYMVAETGVSGQELRIMELA